MPINGVYSLQQELIQLGAQFRLIQKRLISKFKDKNPTPLVNLETLLKDTFAEIMKISSAIEGEREKLSKAQTELSSGLNLISNLLRLMDIKKELSTFESIFSPHVHDLETQVMFNALELNASSPLINTVCRNLIMNVKLLTNSVIMQIFYYTNYNNYAVK